MIINATFFKHCEGSFIFKTADYGICPVVDGKKRAHNIDFILGVSFSRFAGKKQKGKT